MTRLLVILGTIVGVANCDGSRVVPATRSFPFTHAESSAYLDATSGCFFLAQPINPDPVRLVAEYVRRDGQGAFLQTNTWLDSAYDCPGHLPGPDMFTVVGETHVSGQRLTDTISTVFVASTVLGTMTQDSIGPVFEQRPTEKLDTFVTVLTPYGWRIRQPQLPDNVLAAWILANPQRIPLRQPNRDALLRAQRAAAPNRSLQLPKDRY